MIVEAIERNSISQIFQGCLLSGMPDPTSGGWERDRFLDKFSTVLRMLWEKYVFDAMGSQAWKRKEHFFF